MRDRRVPFTTKLVLPGALLYLLFPVDLLPDFFPALGQIDDLTVLMLALLLFVRLCPREVVREHLAGGGGRRPPRRGGESGSDKVIDGEYEILE